MIIMQNLRMKSQQKQRELMRLMIPILNSCILLLDWKYNQSRFGGKNLCLQGLCWVTWRSCQGKMPTNQNRNKSPCCHFLYKPVLGTVSMTQMRIGNLTSAYYWTKWPLTLLPRKRVHSLSVELLNAFVCICPGSRDLGENRITLKRIPAHGLTLWLQPKEA